MAHRNAATVTGRGIPLLCAMGTHRGTHQRGQAQRDETLECEASRSQVTREFGHEPQLQIEMSWNRDEAGRCLENPWVRPLER